MVLAELVKDKCSPVVFYCLSAECWLSYNAVTHAAELGYTNVYWYRGGINAWNKAKLPTHKVKHYLLGEVALN